MKSLTNLLARIYFVEFHMVGWDVTSKDFEYVPVKMPRHRYYYAMIKINLKVLVFRIKQVFKRG